MKKIFGLFVVLSVLVVTGCGGTKKLECSKKYEGQGSQGFIVEYNKDGILKSVTMKMYMANYIEGELTTSERAELNSECDEFNAYGKNVKCEVKIHDKDVELVLSVKNVDKLSADEIEEMDLDDFTDYTYDELKKEVTESGYTCK